MNKIFKLLSSTIVLFISLNIAARKTEEVCYNPNLIKDTTKKSIKSMAYTIINGDSLKISYHSPGVRKRIIWGGLVPYDEVWVTGAHDATTIEIVSLLLLTVRKFLSVSMLSSLFRERMNG